MSFAARFCILDLMGHSQIAGMTSEDEIAGTAFIRVDVPPVDSQPGFTRFFSPAAIYSIQPVDDATCQAAVKALQVKPIQTWTIQSAIRQLAAPTQGDGDPVEFEDDDSEDLDTDDPLDYLSHDRPGRPDRTRDRF